MRIAACDASQATGNRAAGFVLLTLEHLFYFLEVAFALHSSKTTDD